MHFAGYQDDVFAWVSQAGALVMPSRWESFGLAAVDAARCKIPVVATDVPGLREVVQGRAPGWDVPAEDAHALADLLGTLRRPVAAPGPLVGLVELEPVSVADRYWRLVEEVAGDARLLRSQP